jgi:hypothetical protein
MVWHDSVPANRVKILAWAKLRVRTASDASLDKSGKHGVQDFR